MLIHFSVAENVPDILAQLPQSESSSPFTMLEKMYRQAMIKAFDKKSLEMQEKLARGENTLPVAMDIVKISMLSQPTPEILKKTASHVLSLMPEELQKVGIEVGLTNEILSTESPQSPVEVN